MLRFVERSLGGDGVPSDGGWPLCLTDTVLEEVNLPLDEYETHRRNILEERYRNYDDPTTSRPIPTTLETRQWDYKKERNDKGHSIRNPLFPSLDEEERYNLLVSGKATKSKKVSSGRGATTRARSCSVDSTDNNTNYYKNSNNNSNGNGSSSHTAAVFDPIEVRRIRNELEDLRVERSKEQGCTCRKVQVQLNGGKKRTSLLKVKEELRKRNRLPTTTVTRDALEQLLQSLIEQEPCCSAPECPCARNALVCQADSCSCWTHPNNSNNNSQQQQQDEMPRTVKDLQAKCGNIHGMYVVDTEAIRAFRNQMIHSCHVISSETK